MKRFLAWLAVALLLYGGLSLSFHTRLSAHPRRIAVGVDTGFEMQAARDAVAREIRGLSGLRYARYSLFTDKATVHGWKEELDSSAALAFYGPRDLEALADPARHPELREADRVVIVTNASDVSALRGLHGLEVVRPR
jgi:hypothetical protein